MPVVRTHKPILYLAVVSLCIFGMVQWLHKDTAQQGMFKMGANETEPKRYKLVPVPPCECSPLPTDAVLRSLSHEAVAQHYHNYVNSIQMPCHKTVRHGHAGDGGWDVCMDPPYTVEAPCIVYSFGIAHDWTFDDSITDNPGCLLHAYDPSIKKQDHDRKPNLKFHNTGLSNTDETNKKGWRMRTFGSLLKENGHSQSTIDVLKIDIEGSELVALPEMIANGSLDNVKQLCFEIHLKSSETFEQYIHGLTVLKDVYKAGFRIFKTHNNIHTKYNSTHDEVRFLCHEIYMAKSSTKTFGY